MGTNWCCVNSAVFFDPTIAEDTAYGGNINQVPLEDIVAVAEKSVCLTLSLPSFGQTFH